MNKEMFEEYVIEARNLRQQLAIALTLVEYLADGETMEIPMDQLTGLDPAPVTVEDDVVRIG